MFGEYRSAYLAILAIVAGYCAIAIGMTGNAAFFLYDDRPTTTRILIWMLPVIGWYSLVSAKLLLAGRPAPLRRISRYTRLNRWWLSRTMMLIVVMTLWSSGFTVLKTTIPDVVPFYADPMLIEMDRATFGDDPWKFTHALIGPTGTMILDRAYGLWFLVLFGFLGWVIASRNRAFQVQSLLSFVLIWLVLGNLLATLASSVGPCFTQRFFGRDDFVPLMDILRDNPSRLIALDAMRYLEAMYGTSAYASGISAMPSLHVAMAVWFVLVAREGSKSAWLALAAAAYAGVILVGSVHLGWHYAWDGLVSLIVTPLLWQLARRMLRAQSVSSFAFPEDAPIRA